jgi:hypothetical protein
MIGQLYRLITSNPLSSEAGARPAIWGASPSLLDNIFLFTTLQLTYSLAIC